MPSADWVHVDVMDNHFVPNLTLGLPVVEALARVTDQPLDCHLMIEDPDRWAPAYVEAGAPSVTFHVEAAAAPVRLARELRAQGCPRGDGAQAGHRRSSRTPSCCAELDMLLVMTVEPGFGGQEFLDAVPAEDPPGPRADRSARGEVWLQVDGGVSAETIERCAAAGADVFVAGSAVYRRRRPGRQSSVSCAALAGRADVRSA